MASFKGHLYGAAALSSVAALAVYSLGWAGPQQTQWLFLLGVTGGLLPDIDSDNSVPIRGFFTLLGVILAFWMSFSFVGRVPVLALVPIWALVFFTVRFGVHESFARCTVHRGVWHSWLAVAFAGLASANIAHHLGGWTPWQSWLGGTFVALGYLTHLCLDEIANVDLIGSRSGRAFGSALKPFSLAYPWASLGMLATVIGLAVVAPAFDPVLAAWDHYGLDMSAFHAWVPETGWVTALWGLPD